MRRLWIFAAALSLVFALGLTACGGDDDEEAVDTPDVEVEAEPDADVEEAEIRVITPTEVTVGTWDPTHFAAYNSAAEENGWNLEVAEQVPFGEAPDVMRRWGQEGVDVVFSTDNGYEEDFLMAAAEYPDTAWVMMTDLSTTEGLDNVGAWSPDWCELGFLQGATSALVSDTGTVGAAGAIEILPADRTIAGAEFGAEVAEPGTQVLVEFSGDFITVQDAQEVTSSLIRDGADVIIAVTHGGVSAQIAARAQDEGAYYVGSFAPEEDAAPDATVTSAILDFQDSYEEVVNSWLAGDFDASINRLGIADEAIVLTTPFQQGFEEVEAQVSDLSDQLVQGEIEFPADGACAPEEGAGE